MRHDGDVLERASVSNGQTRWVVAVVSAGIVGVLAFLASENYRATMGMLAEHQTRLSALEVREAAKTESARRVEEKVDRLERKVDELLARTPTRR